VVFPLRQSCDKIVKIDEVDLLNFGEEEQRIIKEFASRDRSLKEINRKKYIEQLKRRSEERLEEVHWS